jgi:hypothetical protein
MFNQRFIEKDSDKSEKIPYLTYASIGVGVKVKIKGPVRLVVQKCG